MAIKDFKFESLPPATQMVILGALAASLAAVFYMYFLKDMIADRDRLQAEVKQLEISVAQSKAVAEQAEKFKRELAELEQRLRILRNVLPDQKLTPVIFRSVQDMATMSNLKITKFNPQPVVPRAFHSDWPILVEAQGSYNALGQFFERISKSTRIINVDNIGLRGVENSTDATRTLNATCTATTFVFREEMLGASGGK